MRYPFGVRLAKRTKERQTIVNAHAGTVVHWTSGGVCAWQVFEREIREDR